MASGTFFPPYIAPMAKITLAEAADSGAVGLIIYCVGAPVSGPGCRHSATMTMAAAEASFGTRRLDALPLVCSACGSRQIDVRPWFGATISGGSMPL